MESLFPCNKCARTNFSAIELSIRNGFSNGFKTWKRTRTAKFDLKIVRLSYPRPILRMVADNKQELKWRGVRRCHDSTSRVTSTDRLFQITFSAQWILVTDNKKVKRILDLQYQRWNLKCTEEMMFVDKSKSNDFKEGALNYYVYVDLLLCHKSHLFLSYHFSHWFILTLPSEK